MVVSADGMEWTFDPTGLHDAAVALRTDVAVDASLEIINRLDDVRHSLDLQIWVTPP